MGRLGPNYSLVGVANFPKNSVELVKYFDLVLSSKQNMNHIISKNVFLKYAVSYLTYDQYATIDKDTLSGKNVDQNCC